MATTMNEKFLQELLWNACPASTNDDGSVNFSIKTHCVDYEVQVKFDDANDKPTVISYMILQDALEAPVVVTQ